MRRAAERLWRAIDASTVKRPLATKIVLSSCLTLIADAIVQTLMEGRGMAGYNMERAAHMVSWRCTVHTPFAHWWFNILDKAFGAAPATGIVARKLLADQLLASPFIHFVFFHYMALLEGRSMGDAMEKVRSSFLPLIGGSWVYWSTVNGIGFSMVPLRHRVLWASCGGMVWMGILSAVNQQTNVDADAGVGAGARVAPTAMAATTATPTPLHVEGTPEKLLPAAATA